ncbi:MAG TPA: hypothetical protein VH593_18315, partial [Ktedonobacteraceae bacterium]
MLQTVLPLPFATRSRSFSLLVAGCSLPCLSSLAFESELRRLLHILREPEERRGLRLWWSRFRRGHQAKARACHVQRCARQAPPIASLVSEPMRLPGLPFLT